MTLYRGARPRKSIVSQEELANRHESIFGKKESKPRYVPPPLPEDMQNLESSHEKLLGKNVPLGRT
jgi:hypothetical protein